MSANGATRSDTTKLSLSQTFFFSQSLSIHVEVVSVCVFVHACMLYLYVHVLYLYVLELLHICTSYKHTHSDRVLTDEAAEIVPDP